MTQRRITNPALFVCDLQEKFRPAIYEFEQVIRTTQKLLRACQVLDVPVFATTQNKSRLGETCPELLLDCPGGVQTLVQDDKTLFSMLTPNIRAGLSTLPTPITAALIGIESHICVTQTALDLLADKHIVYIIADGVSSCNKEEIPIALNRLRHAGAVVTTSEGFLYEIVGDAGLKEFKEVIKIVKENYEGTKGALELLCPR